MKAGTLASIVLVAALGTDFPPVTFVTGFRSPMML